MVDLVPVPSDVRSSGDGNIRIAGEALVRGEWVRKNPDTGKYLKADKGTEEGAKVEGMVLCDADVDQQVLISRDGDVIVPGASLEVGTTYALSTSGAIAPEADLQANEWVSYVGTTISATEVRQKISVTGKQK